MHEAVVSNLTVRYVESSLVAVNLYLACLFTLLCGFIGISHNDLIAVELTCIHLCFHTRHIPDCSHWVQRDAPDVVNQYMREFMQD